MSRLNTPFHHGDIAPDATGAGTLYPWVLSLGTIEGYRAFDVVMAALFRMDSWRITGSLKITVDPGGPAEEEKEDLIDVESAWVTGPGGVVYGTEWDFASTHYPDPPENQRLVSGGYFDFPVPGPIIVNGSAYVPFDFQFTDTPETGLAPRGSGDGGVTEPEIGTITIRVPGWTGGPHELSTSVFNQGAVPPDSSPRATILIEAASTLGYADADGIAVWGGSGIALLNPLTARV